MGGVIIAMVTFIISYSHIATHTIEEHFSGETCCIKVFKTPGYVFPVLGWVLFFRPTYQVNNI